MMVRVPVRKVAIVRPWATTGASALRGVTRREHDVRHGAYPCIEHAPRLSGRS